jgi:glutaredoxin
VKEFLSQAGISYVERDVATDEEAYKELEAMGYMTTPVVRINGDVVVGFNRARLEELLLK